MKVAYIHLIAASTFIAATGANAALVTVTPGATLYKGSTISGPETQTFGENFVQLLAGLQATLSPEGVQLVSTQDGDGALTSAITTTPVMTLKVEDTNDEISNITAAGGWTVRVPAQASANGGSLTVIDFDIDVVNKKVFATLIGANGVGTQRHVPLWDIANVLGRTTLGAPAGGTSFSQLQVSGLHFTPTALNTLATALGLDMTLKSAIGSALDFGTVDVSLTATSTVQAPPCLLNFKTTTSSSGLFASEVTLANATGNTVKNWNVSWHYDKATVLSSIKNAKITRRGYTDYMAQPVSANSSLAPWGAAVFSFRGYAGKAIPTVSNVSATLGGQVCAVTTQ